MKKLLLSGVPMLLFFCFAFTPAPRQKTIVIDAGHGGDDAGVIHNEIAEKELVLSIASQIKSLNTLNSVNIVLLREEDHFMSPEDRLNAINAIHPDLLISLHINYSQNKRENGISAFVSKANKHYTESKNYAENMIHAIGTGKLFKKEVKDVNLFTLNNVMCPALMLEMGYLTNEHDRNYISSAFGQQEIASKIIESLSR
jgi:N-acetylmuramoyl-L-alanine amidase